MTAGRLSRATARGETTVQSFKNLPNIITMVRLFLVPVIVATITGGRWLEAFIAFLLAGLSDALDGWLAKRFSLAD